MCIISPEGHIKSVREFDILIMIIIQWNIVSLDNALSIISLLCGDPFIQYLKANLINIPKCDDEKKII